MVVDIGKAFYHRLVNRDEKQGDGKKTAIEFREKYLQGLDSKEAWDRRDIFITLDFNNVKVLGPSFASEAFAYFTRYTKPDKIMKRINFVNITNVKKMIIYQELVSGYKDR